MPKVGKKGKFDPGSKTRFGNVSFKKSKNVFLFEEKWGIMFNY